MRTTPFAAREPYRAEAAGPFSTDMDSMSSGLMSITRLAEVVADFEEPSNPELPTTREELS